MGREEGSKDRPCAIVLTVREEEGQRVWVVPVTHSSPGDATVVIEIPTLVKERLGLDSERSWIVLSETNEFVWPGPDLRRVAERQDESVAYGFLPPRFFAEVRSRFLTLARARRSIVVKRTV